MNSIYPASFIEEHRTPSVNPLLLPTEEDLIKKETAEYGVGIYARRLYARGESVGQFLAAPARDLRQHTLQRAPDDHLYDPHFVGYLLHSCDPNVVVDMHQQAVYCVKDIPVGEPLCMDYATTEDVLFKQFPCGCGAPNCRQWITGRHELVSEEGMQHLAKAGAQSAKSV